MEDIEPDDSYVILSLDGGGVRGYLSLLLLEQIEAALNDWLGGDVPLGARVDLVAGTSTGGIIALCLGAGMRASRIREMYKDWIPGIFDKERQAGLLARWKQPLYPCDQLEAGLREYVGDRTLADSICDLCITSVALQSAKPRLFKTDYFERNRPRASSKMWEVGLATSAAPTYFKAHDASAIGGGDLVDGGLVANNPAMIALVDALCMEKDPHRPVSHRGAPVPKLSEGYRNVLMISVGTGVQGLIYTPKKLSAGGKIEWAAHAAAVCIEAQSFATHFQAKELLGPERYLRLDPLVRLPVRLDDAKGVGDLQVLGDLDAEPRRFLRSRAAAFARLSDRYRA